MESKTHRILDHISSFVLLFKSDSSVDGSAYLCAHNPSEYNNGIQEMKLGRFILETP